MARAYGSRAQMALAFESTYGTAPGSGFAKVPFIRSTLGATEELLPSDVLGFGRDPLAPDKDALDLDGDVVVPVDVEAFGLWLKGAFGSPSTTGSGPYTHVFTSGGYTLPSMSIETGMPEVPRFAMDTGCRVNSLSWDMQRKGHLSATVNLIGQTEASETTSQAGTLASYTLARFMQRHGSVTRGGSALGDVVSARVNYSNNLEPIDSMRGDGLIDGVDPTMAELSGQLTVRFGSETLLDQAINGDSAAFTFALSRGASQSLTLSVPRVFLPRPKLQVEGPQGIQATFDWVAARQTDGNPMGSVTLVNSVESY